jgi:hypothetical protein
MWTLEAREPIWLRMENRAAWVTRIDAALERIEIAHSEVEVAHRRVRDSYRDIAETIEGVIEESRLRHETLTQIEIAEHIGKSATWVSRVLAWHRAGVSSEGPFGYEIAARRAAAKLEHEIATSQSEAEPIVNEADLGQGWLFDRNSDGYSNYRPGQSEATIQALNLLGACLVLVQKAASVRHKTLALVRPSADDKRIFSLEKLSLALERSIDAGGQVLREVLTVQSRTCDLPRGRTRNVAGK